MTPLRGPTRTTAAYCNIEQEECLRGRVLTWQEQDQGKAWEWALSSGSKTVRVVTADRRFVPRAFTLYQQQTILNVCLASWDKFGGYLIDFVLLERVFGLIGRTAIT